MTNISLLEDRADSTTAFLFCYNKRYNFYVTVEGKASIASLVDEPRTPEGWVDPILKAQRTYLILFDVERAVSHFRHGALPMKGPVTAVTDAAKSGKLRLSLPSFLQQRVLPRL